MQKISRCICAAVAMILVASVTSPSASLAQEESARKFRPDLRIAQTKRFFPKINAAKAGKFDGDNEYDGSGTIANGLTAPAEPDTRVVYLVMVQNDGTRTDDIRFSFQPEDVPELRKDDVFTTGVYTTFKKNGKYWRDEDITEDARASTKGIDINLRSKRQVILWFEIETSSKVDEEAVARWSFEARSLGAGGSDVALSSFADDKISTVQRDRLFAQIGSPGGNGADALDLTKVNFAHIVGGYPQQVNIAEWEITSELGDVVITPGFICVPHTKMAQWPDAEDVGGRGTLLEGNPWIIAEIDGKLWTGFWEWMLASGGDACKTMSSNPPFDTVADQMPDHIKAGPFATWIPQKGDKVWFFVTSLAWPGIDEARERTQVVGPFEWPF